MVILLQELKPEKTKSDIFPVFRSGSCSDIGAKKNMEDEHICLDNLDHFLNKFTESTDICKSDQCAFYGVS